MHRFGHPWVYEHMRGDEFGWWPGALLSALNTIFWLALFIGLAWALLRWVFPYILPIMADIFGRPSSEPAALEILRQRYAAGEIDAVTFEQMRERLEASYQQESNSILHDDNGYLHKTRTNYHTFSSLVSREQENIRMAAREGYPSETEQ